ncbi:hypothetical protein BDV93DRAFT_491401 [Ceratobasidium sp. AG-I]|nr:hypothetical protein BDV93DRAFT_491401 [Ceratobasidium sp. AG-I]
MKRTQKSLSSVSSVQTTGDDEGRDELINMLNSHGKSFLDSFDIPASRSTQPKASKKRKRLPQDVPDAKSPEEPVPKITKEQQRVVEDPGPSTRRVPDVVVFNERASGSSQPVARGAGKGFMSSKIHHVIEAPKSMQLTSDPGHGSEVEEELSNTKNDKLLHELVHSKLLSNPDAFNVEQGSAKRNRTMAGRLVELADGAKVGQGATSLKAKEQSKHAKRVRLGLKAKAQQREAQALDEAKALGNYHPSIKRNFASSSSGPAKQRRERGLALGIGKFRSGALTLSKDDLRSVQGPPSGRGGKRR